jgi:L-amino acid N-acyltransferase YncA
MNVRQATEADAAIIAEMYNWYILNTIITFETDAVSPDEMKERIYDKLTRYDWIVGELHHEIIGYAYYGPFRPRAAYHHTVESTIYLSQTSISKGFGKVLYANLVESAKSRGFREVIGVIALPNPPSITLHREIGFKEVGVLRSVGYKFGRYIDVGLWQRSLT